MLVLPIVKLKYVVHLLWFFVLSINEYVDNNAVLKLLLLMIVYLRQGPIDRLIAVLRAF